MFKELFSMLKSDEHFGVSYEIEILKGLCAKSKGFKDTIRKIKRNKKLINGR